MVPISLNENWQNTPTLTLKLGSRLNRLTLHVPLSEIQRKEIGKQISITSIYCAATNRPTCDASVPNVKTNKL